MGFLKSMNTMNPLTFKRKVGVAWNIWAAAYTFEKLPADQQEKVRQKVAEIQSQASRKSVTFEETMERCRPEQKYLFFSLAMAHLEIFPALGNGIWWFEVKNPYVDVIGAEVHINSVRKQIEKEHNVNLPNL